MRRARLVVLIGFAVISFMESGSAQVTAHQGTPDAAEEPTRFKSPMVLDLPLTVADQTYWGRGEVRSSAELAVHKYSCDGVTFVDFASSADKAREGNVRITFRFTVATDRGIDKLATVKFAVMAGDREVAAVTSRPLDAEEGKRASGKVSFLISEKDLKATPSPTLRLVMHVKDNG